MLPNCHALKLPCSRFAVQVDFFTQTGWACLGGLVRAALACAPDALNLFCTCHVELKRLRAQEQCLTAPCLSAHCFQPRTSGCRRQCPQLSQRIRQVLVHSSSRCCRDTCVALSDYRSSHRSSHSPLSSHAPLTLGAASLRCLLRRCLHPHWRRHLDRVQHICVQPLTLLCCCFKSAAASASDVYTRAGGDSSAVSNFSSVRTFYMFSR